MSPSPLASKLKYFTTPELMNLIKSFSAKSPANSSAVVTAVDYIEHKPRPTANPDGASSPEPFTQLTIEYLEKTTGLKFTSHGRAASLLSRLSRPVIVGIADKVTFFQPNPPCLPECWAKLNQYSREELISICEDFSAISEESQSDITALAKESEEQKEIKRAGIVLDHDTAVRVENVENALGYRFADPRKLVDALTHPSSHRSVLKRNVFSVMRSDGESSIDLIAEMHLDGPRYMYEGKEFKFPCKVADVIKESATSSEFLARVAVRLGLLENSLHRLSAAARGNVGRFEASVEKGEFDVRPPKILGELTQTVGGSIGYDCDCFEVFYLRWADNLFLQDNPVFVLYDRYKTDNLFVCRRDNPDFYPSITQKSGVWVVEHRGKILGSGKTIMEAADAANRKEH